MASHFAMVDQATQYLKKVEQYVSAGMDTTIEVAEDVVKGDKGKIVASSPSDQCKTNSHQVYDDIVKYCGIC